MAGQLALGYMKIIEEPREEKDKTLILEASECVRPSVSQSMSNPALTIYRRLTDNDDQDDATNEEVGDTLENVRFQLSSRPSNRRSSSTADESPPVSRSSSPQASPTSSATTPSVYTVESFIAGIADRSQTSVLSRLKSSISTASTSTPRIARQSVQPSDFRIPPEIPEKRFVDSIGVVCPGVEDRRQCASPRAHFVSTFRICQPIEYTTAFADHGITYTDYLRLLACLSNFLTDYAIEKKLRVSKDMLSTLSGNQRSIFALQESVAMRQIQRRSALAGYSDTTEQLETSKRQAKALNQLLEAITSKLRARGLPVVICVSSFSLFAPHRISEAHIQILHNPLAHNDRTMSATPDARSAQRLSFMDPCAFAAAAPRSVSRSWPRLEERSQSESAAPTLSSKHYHQTCRNRDHSRPWPLWPNAIPSRKRQAMDENSDRYGVDPHFRAWMRANINSRTRSSTYAKYMIEQEDDPFVNRRLQYTDGSSRPHLLWDVMSHGPKAWKEQFPSTMNRAKYEHNRKLECRRTVEQGSRLRILRFGFRHAIYPPHSPEMAELGLTRIDYETIISNIEHIHTNAVWYTKCPISYLFSTLNKIRHRSTEDASKRVSEYLRVLNASQRRIVWTIEKIPGVYDRGLARDRTEWEISAWNGEDPLELLIELERWGIIEQRLSIEDDE
jgi:hypothetical protein